MRVEPVGGPAQPHPEAAWCPDWLFNLVFAKDAGTDYTGRAEPELRSYLLVDGTLFNAVAGPAALEDPGIPVMSLFQGQAASDHAAAAPYIMDITLPEGLGRDAPPALKAFAQRHWGRQSGVVLRSRASLEQMRAHLRHFTRLKRVDTGRWALFRFWDARIALPYFSALAQWPDRESTWFRPGDCPPIEAMVFEGDRPDEAWHLVPSAASSQPVLRPDTQLHAYEIAVLRDSSRALFQLQLTRGLAALHEKTGAWPVSTGAWQQFVGLAHGEALLHGFTTRQSIARFALFTTRLGLDFMSDPRFDLRERQIMRLQEATETERFEAAWRIEKDFSARLTADGGEAEILARAKAAGISYSPEKAFLEVAPSIAAPMGPAGISDFIARLARYYPGGRLPMGRPVASDVARAATFGTGWPGDPRYAAQDGSLAGEGTDSDSTDHNGMEGAR